MTPKDYLLRICDNIDTQNIIDELTNFFSSDDINEFCDYLVEQYGIETEFDFYDNEY